MKILIFTNHFYPEDFKVNDIAFDWVSRGNDVTVITGLPNYPKGDIYKGYGFFRKRKENIKGVQVIRLPLIPRGNGQSLRLMLNYVTYLISLLLYLPVLLATKYDRIFVHETSPIFIGIPAVLCKKIRRAPLYFWVLDLWPESVLAASNIKNKYLIKGLERLVKWIYANSDKILVTSKGFEKSICDKGNFKNKIVYIPNWAESLFEEQIIERPLPKISFPDKFLIMYAGNIGEAQNIDTLARLMLETSDFDIHWVFLGDGRKKEWLSQYIKENDLSESVSLLGRYDLKYMPYFFSKANMMFFSLKDDPIFKLTVPARLQSYMAMGKPIIAMIEGEAANIINESCSGVVSDCYDIAGIKEQIKPFLKDQIALSEISENSLSYYKRNFNRQIILDKLYNELR